MPSPRPRPFTPDDGLDRDLAALVGLGLPDAEGFRAEGQPLRDWLDCRACGKRGVTLHHVVPNWICRATGAKEVLEPLCPECHAAVEILNWKAAEQALSRADLLALTLRRFPVLAPAIDAWKEWTRWERRLRNLSRAGRMETPEGVEAEKRAAASRRSLAKHREKLRAAVRKTAAAICRDRVDYLRMPAAWTRRPVASLRPEDFVR